jgi:HEAT repeat protein
MRDLLEQVADLLDSDASLEVKREAARTLHDLPDVKFYDIYIKNLKSEDGLVCAYMALALGDKLKLKKAVPALIEAADPQRPIECYRSAARALIQIGDPRAIPALRKVAETDPSEEIRKYVNKGIEKLEAQAAH